MRTAFSPAQLEDPVLRAAEAELRRCVHCGICTATCPTYLLHATEPDGPRGRIQLIQQMLERDAIPDAGVQAHLDGCLSCNACVSACPSGVNYPRLIDAARAHVVRRAARPAGARALRALLGFVLPRRRLFAGLSALARRLGSLRPLLPAGLRPAFDAARAAPQREPARGALPATGPREHVALHVGCVQEEMAPRITESAERVLAALGIGVVRVEGEGCCGALNHHLGQEKAAKRRAAALCRDVGRQQTNAGISTLVTTATGCGAAIRDFGFLLGDKGAGAVGAMTVDIVAFLADRIPRETRTTKPLRIAVHAPCSLQHAMKGAGQTPALLRRLGFEVVEFKDRQCCGSAGTYSLLEPANAQALGRAKADEIRALAPDLVVSGNIGCIAQLASGSAVPVRHVVEVLDAVLSGQWPAGAGS
jgi:glycolate oxidase iron-sulfur subunit